MEQETLGAVIEHIVNHLFVELGAKSYSGKRLCFTAGEHCRAVRTRNIVGFAPDWTYFGGLAAVETNTFVEHATAHSFFFYIVIVTLDERSLFFAFLFRNRFDELVADSLEAVGTPMLVGATCLSNGVCLVVAHFLNLGTQFFVIHFVAIFALNGRANFFSKFHLSLALNLDCFVSSLQCFQQVAFANFVHFALNHHDIVIRSTYHQIHVSLFKFTEGWVNNEFAIDACHTHFTDRTIKWNVRYCQCSRSSQAGKCIGHVYAVAREHYHVHESFGVIVVGEQRTQHTVNQTRCENFVVRSTSFTLGEAARESACCRKFFFVFNCKWHKVHSFTGFFCRYNCRQKHCVVQAQFNRSIGLLCKFSCFKGDNSSITHVDGFFDRCQHNLIYNSALFENSCKVSKYSALLLLNSSIITFFN